MKASHETSLLASLFHGRENELYWESRDFHLKIAPAEHENTIMFIFFNVKNVFVTVSAKLEMARTSPPTRAWRGFIEKMQKQSKLL